MDQLRAQADAVVANLVTQFADPFDALRELCQNSIDAGTSRIEVWTSFEGAPGKPGVIEIHVDDFGEGMDEAIIDNQFTRLFASTKDKDFTKIGKFGIGFVSVFALKPKAVLVHTGRGGEYWEVLFDHELNIHKSTLNVPVEGTQITIFLEGDQNRYQEVVKRSFDSLKKWCVHAETEIWFEDRSSKTVKQPVEITEAWGLPGRSFHYATEGTEAVLAFSDAPRYSFYNRGLTLAYAESPAGLLPTRIEPHFAHISVKMKSRYLEHTLSRDTIVKDVYYESAMSILQRARLDMFAELVKDVVELVKEPTWNLDHMLEYCSLMEQLSLAPDIESFNLLNARIFRTHGGKGVTPMDLLEMYESKGRVLISPDLTSFVENVGKDEVILGASQLHHAQNPLRVIQTIAPRVMVLAYKESLVGRVVQYFWPRNEAMTKSIKLPESVFVSIEVVEADLIARKILDDVLSLTQTAGLRFKRIELFRPTTEHSPFFVVAEKLATLMERPSAGAVMKELAVNELHPHFQRLKKLYNTHPDVAVFCLARALLIDDSGAGIHAFNSTLKGDPSTAILEEIMKRAS